MVFITTYPTPEIIKVQHDWFGYSSEAMQVNIANMENSIKQGISRVLPGGVLITQNR